MTTPTTRLVTRSEPGRSELLASRPIPTGDLATVYLSRQSTLKHAERPLTVGEVLFDRPRALYLVDTSVHVLTFTMDLPASEESLAFQAEVQATWQITRPCEAVSSALTEVEPVVRPWLEQQFRRISRQSSIEDSAGAEQAILTFLNANQSKPLEQGVTLVRCSVLLRSDQGTKKHKLTLVEIERARAKRSQNHETKTYDTALTIREQEGEHNLASLRAENARKLQAQDERHKLDLERLRMDHYAQVLQGGDMGLIALQLAAKPDDVDQVINLLMRQRELDYDGARGMLTSLLENNLVNRKDVSDIMARATKVVADRLTDAPFTIGAGKDDRQALPGGPVPMESVPAAVPVTAEIVLDSEDDDDDDVD